MSQCLRVAPLMGQHGEKHQQKCRQEQDQNIEDVYKRQAEALVKRLSAEKKEAQAKDPDEVDYLAEAQNELKARLCRGVKIVPGRKKGRIELEYYGVDDLNDLLDALAVIKVSQLKKGPQA